MSTVVDSSFSTFVITIFALFSSAWAAYFPDRMRYGLLPHSSMTDIATVASIYIGLSLDHIPILESSKIRFVGCWSCVWKGPPVHTSAFACYGRIALQPTLIPEFWTIVLCRSQLLRRLCLTSTFDDGGLKPPYFGLSNAYSRLGRVLKFSYDSAWISHLVTVGSMDISTFYDIVLGPPYNVEHCQRYLLTSNWHRLGRSWILTRHLRHSQWRYRLLCAQKSSRGCFAWRFYIVNGLSEKICLKIIQLVPLTLAKVWLLPWVQCCL